MRCYYRRARDLGEPRPGRAVSDLARPRMPDYGTLADLGHVRALADPGSRQLSCAGGSRISAGGSVRAPADPGRLPACPRILTRKIISSTFMEVDRTEKMRGRKKILPPFENLRKGLWGLPFPRPLSSSSAPTWV